MAQDTRYPNGRRADRRDRDDRGGESLYGLYRGFMRELRDVGEMQNRTALILERLTSTVDRHTEDIRELKARDRREETREYDRMKETPEYIRGWIQTFLSLLALFVSIWAITRH